MEVLRVAIEPLIGQRGAVRAGAPRLRHALLASWALVLLAGGTLVAILPAERSAPAPAARRSPAPQRGLATLPPAAQGVVSGALGAASPAYRVSAAGSGFQARNPTAHMRVRFGSSGVQIGSGGLHLDLSLRGVGYGTSLRPLGAVRPRARANRVTYALPGLREWYQNGPLGLEQGFTLPRAPRAHPAGPLTFALAYSGGGEATLAAGRGSLQFGRAGGAWLRYGDLLATDARGRALHIWLELRPGRVLLRLDTRGARYPLRIDPLIQQGGKLTGEGGYGGSLFGESVALSADGNTALVGGGGDHFLAGAAWVFTRAGSTWTQQGPKLVAPSAPDSLSELGRSVALSADGNVALVGAPGNGEEVGEAWIFTRTGTTWTLGPELTGGGEESGAASFGDSVALSADASTALVGGEGDDSAAGAAWVFTRSGATWTQQGAKLTSGESSEPLRFGHSVALSADGETALVGDDTYDFQQGAAWVFTRSSSTWTQQGERLRAPMASEEGVFGSSVALSGEGTTALIADPGPPGTQIVGGAWVFTRAGSTWTQQGAELTSVASGETAFGASVALSADGSTALIGSGRDSSGRGVAWVFRHSGATWTKQAPELTGGQEESGDGDFGASVALSSDGGTALIGGPNDDEELGAPGARGAAWTFASAPPNVTTSGASSVGTAAAALNGEVDPDGLASTAYFQYGTTTAYGQSTAGQSAGSAEGFAPFSTGVAGLAPGTTYHFRIAAENAGGTSYGADQTFTTAPFMPVPVAPVSTTAPKISGTPIRGQALSVSQGAWSNSPTSFTYQWESCNAAGNSCAALRGATGAAHVLTQGDVGHTLRAIVTAADAGGSSAATSNASPVVGSQVEAAMTWTFGWARTYTIVESLIVHEIPPGGSVELTCHGRGCPFARAHAARASGHSHCAHRRCKPRHPSSQSEVSLTRLFKGRHLGVGTRVAVHIVKSGWVGKSYLFITRANQRPHFQIACLAPGSSRPGRGC
jgi:hypothetical protein